MPNGNDNQLVPDAVDLANLNEEQQKLFNAAFGKGAAKVEETKLKALMEEHKTILSKLSSTEETAKLTENDRNTLKQRLRDIENQGLTEKQQYERELASLRTDHETKMKTASEEALSWKAQHHGMIIVNGLTQEAIAADAYMPAQVVELLKSQVEIIEDGGSDGAPKKYVPKIRTIGEDGKPVLSDLKDGVSAFLAKNPNLVKSKVVRGPDNNVTAMLTASGETITREKLGDAKWVNEHWDEVAAILQNSGKR
jgi:hypothetical protein